MIVILSILFHFTVLPHFLIIRALIRWVYAHEDLSAGIITGIILAIALTVAIRTLRAMRHDRATAIATNLRRDYESGVVFEGRALHYKIYNELKRRGIKDTSDAFASTVNCYKNDYPCEFLKLISVGSLFDMAGWLIRSGCCDVTAIHEQLDWESYYNLWKTYIRNCQNRSPEQPLDDSPTAFYGNFVWLANKLLATTSA